MGESSRKIRLVLTAEAMFLYQPYFVSQRLFQLPSNWLCSWFEPATLIERKIAGDNFIIACDLTAIQADIFLRT